MRQLPCASPTEHQHLNERPLDNACVRRLGLIAELCFALLQHQVISLTPPNHITTYTYPLENLLPLDILQPPIQIPHLLHNIVQFPLIRALNITRLSNRQIQRKLNRAALSTRHSTAQPAAGGGARRRETDAVVAGVSGGEGEAAFGGAALGDDAVVGVEGFVDSDGDGDGGGGDVGLGCRIVLVGFVVAWQGRGRLESGATGEERW